MLTLEHGTVTNLIGVQVKFKQAKADALTLRANLKGAKDQLNTIVGQHPENTGFALPNLKAERLVLVSNVAQKPLRLKKQWLI